MHVNLQNAEQVIEAARKKAVELKTKMCIAVVDSGANLKAFVRMDDAWVGSIDIAIKKARTACFFGMATGDLGQLSQPAKPLYGIEHSNNGLITFPGGLPIVDEDGVLVGAIGVSGSSVENDHEVAAAGVDVLGVSELPEHPWRT
ncbi:MAG: GlcG/HbpS family heme-binding protein [Alphaproteobacteria bacterium]